jgi:hypothetical protein
MAQARGYLSNLVGKQVSLQQQHKQLTAELKGLQHKQAPGNAEVRVCSARVCSAQAHATQTLPPFLPQQCSGIAAFLGKSPACNKTLDLLDAAPSID